MFEREPTLLSLVSERVTEIRLCLIIATDQAISAMHSSEEDRRETFEDSIDRMLDAQTALSDLLPMLVKTDE